MAKPSTREELKQYCLRTLGKPVIEINVEDDKLEDRMDEGLQFFQEYHFDGVERMYNIHRITGSTVKIASNTGAFTVGEKITGGTSNATAKVVSSNTTVITFKSHKDTDDISNNDVTSSFSNAETITKPLPDQFISGVTSNVLLEKIAVKLASTIALKKIISLSTFRTLRS